MSNISEQFLVNLSQSLGISYNLKKNVLGSNSNPNSALFNISQIGSLLLYGRPNFGVYDSVDSFATLTFNSTSNLFQFSSGQVFYQKNLITMPSQSIPATSSTDLAGTKLFKFYIDYSDFLLSSQVYTSKITSINGSLITVDQLPLIEYLNNFKVINLNNFLINITNIDSNSNTISLSQDVSTIASVGSTLNLIFQPLIKSQATFAIMGSPPDLEIPSSAIAFAEAELSITGTTTLSYTCSLGVVKTFTAFGIYNNPADLFPSQAAYNSFLNSVNSSIKAYNNVQTYDLESSLVTSFINYTTGIATNVSSFDQYWHLQPFKPSSIFQYGINFSGLQKVDFDSRFKDFWYDFKNTDLTRTFAVFRGDIYGGNSYIGQVAGKYPGTVAINNYVDYSGQSTNYNGTFSYGVSAVSPIGEYSPVFSASGQFYFNNRVNNYISWTSSTPISNLLFYHVYKNVQVTNGFEQQRLTSPYQISGYTLNDTILTKLNTVQGIGSSNFAFKIKSNDLISGIIGGIYFNGYISDPTPLTGIQSYIISSGGSGYVSPRAVISGLGVGASVILHTDGLGALASAQIISFGSGYTQIPTITILDDASIKSTGGQIIPVLSQLSCGIYTGSSSNPLGQPVATFEPISIASISSTYPINLPLSGANFVTINSSTNYWAVFQMNTPYSLNANQYLNFNKSSGFSGSYASSNDLTNWSFSATQVQIAKLGFVDQNSSGVVSSSRGVYLTDDKSSSPTRLQIFIPNMDLSGFSFDDAGVSVFNNAQLQTSLPIQNSMTVYVLAQNSLSGVTKTLVGSIPKGTTRGQSIALGTVTDLFDKVLDVFVEPNLAGGMNYVTGTQIINWTIYDLFTIDSMP